ncbi:MAG: hypothetical protein HYX74_05965 [Acidobacteria bacterium]|nr:hypothetical protein [Acidobacteriota bacterium]
MKKGAVLAIFAMFALSLFVMADQQKGSWTGWISDDHCGAKGTNAKHADCAAKCIAGGAKAVLVAGSDIYAVTNQDAVKDHLAHHVKVTGTLDTESKTINIDKVEMVAEK